MLGPFGKGIRNVFLFSIISDFERCEVFVEILEADWYITVRNYLPMISDLQVGVINLLIFCKWVVKIYQNFVKIYKWISKWQHFHLQNISKFITLTCKSEIIGK